jgi:hypothetical protein
LILIYFYFFPKVADKEAFKGLIHHHNKTVVELPRKIMVSCLTGDRIAHIYSKHFLISKRKEQTSAKKKKNQVGILFF